MDKINQIEHDLQVAHATDDRGDPLRGIHTPHVPGGAPVSESPYARTMEFGSPRTESRTHAMFRRLNAGIERVMQPFVTSQCDQPVPPRTDASTTGGTAALSTGAPTATSGRENK